MISNVRKIEGLMISSSDVGWNVNNDVKIFNKLKRANKNVVVNDSDSEEEVEDGRCFLKRGVLTDLWGSIVKHLGIDCTCK